ncbi:ethanolamine utilization protein EutQ [Marvinbryantia formatexigens DSM 14469]|uniref:Ethanolamine utilization protein EutQ n=1 Tax=Marvinbryantia formatexigens DSM 14469 TaxID=478749 RepID=C6LEW0_9FIRM|nr:cupin domain-containing protein [Marvinbryantia formatexigens]EET60699.1 ethanolamine utilization protein EutQ [Marvinbryantia formatexigens DSM 14469]UWO23006.1 cupin domain-containing protein [Marvinbryantia formatexigens DSM 14469]SDG35291.1 ethanolamine utilization protein EutQ [Marvinbryantia formatexigens]
MNISEELIREIITKVLETATQEQKTADCGFEKIVDPSGIIGIKTSTVKCEPFQQEGVALKDVVTLEEAPRMGCGIMELDHTSFEWTLTYDEYDMVIEGTLEIEIDGRVISAGPGDIIYIPKNSHIHFQTQDKTRYAYFVYPANWSELG